MDMTTTDLLIRLGIAILVILLVHVIWVAIYRLYLSPIAHFPGPNLAALTTGYEFYYNVVQEGRFSFHVRELHRKYGPIIRISPTELHIMDPEFFETLYARSPNLDKYDYFARRFGHASDTFSTSDHTLHRSRRKALGLMFSVKRIDEFEPTVKELIEKLCSVIATYTETDQILSLSRAWMALTTDIITEYAFARSYGHLDSPGFEESLHDAMMTVDITGNFALHFPIIFPILERLPVWTVRKFKPVLLPVLGLRYDLAEQVKQIREGTNAAYKEKGHATIFHELLNSNLPPAEKTDARLGDEAQLVIAAGLLTTYWALTVASYYIINDPHIHETLRRELEEDARKAAQESQKHSSEYTYKQYFAQLTWHRLQTLPYLSGCVYEAVRLSTGVPGRNPRISQDRDLQYGPWTIPRGTPVSMYSMHVLMDETVFPNPHKFDPNRWIDNPGLERYFVAFGKGSRSCLGINLAQAEIYLALAAVFGRFTFQLHDTDVSDVQTAHTYLLPYPKWDSKGVRVRVVEDRTQQPINQ
ncbi:Cytochrome P450 monooxygenase sdnE [Exophiala dermatitidis]